MILQWLQSSVSHLKMSPRCTVRGPGGGGWMETSAVSLGIFQQPSPTLSCILSQLRSASLGHEKHSQGSQWRLANICQGFFQISKPTIRSLHICLLIVVLVLICKQRAKNKTASSLLPRCPNRFPPVSALILAPYQAPAQAKHTAN